MTQQQIDALNAAQSNDRLHPLTCGRNRHDAAHKAYQAEHGGDAGQLVATEHGWVCPVPGCDYQQGFQGALEGMLLEIDSLSRDNSWPADR